MKGRESGIELRWPRVMTFAKRVVVVSAFLFLIGPVVHVMPQGAGSSWTGWDEVAARAETWEERIDVEDGVEGNLFFFCSDYRDSAQLGRNLMLLHDAGTAMPELEPTLAQNVLGQPSLQFDHWTSPTDRIGQDAIYVLPRADRRPNEIEKVAARFRSIEKKDRVEIRRLGVKVGYADVYVCRDYRGPNVAGG